MDYKTVQVHLPNKTGIVEAKVGLEDYDKVAALKWRRCSSGYAINVKRVEGRLQTTYMHKLIYGGPARHLNGNRMDNTRDNLVNSSRRCTGAAVSSGVAMPPAFPDHTVVLLDQVDPRNVLPAPDLHPHSH